MRYFGTDGVRGGADWILKSNIACKLGEALAEKGSKVVVARDVRAHSFDIEKQLVGGLLTKNTDIRLCGVLPTPALAYTADTENADYAVMITASHNAPEYNGLKVFGKGGRKLSLCEERALDDALFKRLPDAGGASASTFSSYEALSSNEFLPGIFLKAQSDKEIFSLKPDRIEILEGAERNYKRRILSMFPKFTGMKVRLDLAHGCFAELAADVFSDLGADVTAINDDRDGENVNVACGSTHITRFEVKKNEIGFAFDGDGDRVLAVVDGKVYDGDAILLALSMLYRLRGKLKNRFVVGTLLSNSRLQRELAWQGTVLLRADVGDKNVLNMLSERECPLGGEKSGHIIMADKASTGDGLLTALTLLEAKKTMGSLPKFSPYPMREYNIRAEDPKTAIRQNDFVTKIARAEEAIGTKGRMIVRPSGTEPFIRIAVEYYAKNHGEIFTRVQNIFGL